MRQLKLLFLAVLALTFAAGLGAGAWIGSLRASAPAAPNAAIDARVRDWNEIFDLDRSQNRHLRAVLAYYDEQSEQVRRQLDAERFQRLQRLRTECRERLRTMLTPDQRAEYDRRGGGE